jgi:hypothetical protein
MIKHRQMFTLVTAALLAVLSACGSDDKDKDGDALADASSPVGTGGGDGGRRIDPGAIGADGGLIRPGNNGGGNNTAPAQVCPAAQPANATACTPGRGDCDYGTTVTCDCPDQSKVWQCLDTKDCPAAAPAERAACTSVGLECEYRMAGAPRQDATECECAANGWNCGRQFCPPAEPAAGAACEGGDGTCNFGGRVCDCTRRQWTCWNASDCPAAPPVAAGMCPTVNMVCDYPSDECSCTSRGWECESEDDNPRRRDGGTRDAGAPTDAGAVLGMDAG